MTQVDHNEIAEMLGKMPDAKSAADVRLMSDAIRALPESKHGFMAHELVHNDLMLMTDPATKPIVDEAKRQGVLADAMRMLAQMMPQVATEMVQQAADHCESGTDETGEGVGGWSQEEMELAYASLFVARDGLTIPFGSAGGRQ